MFVGIDSKVIHKPVLDPPPIPPEGVKLEHFAPLPVKRNYQKLFSYLLGASVSVSDIDKFYESYFTNLEKAITASDFNPTRKIYSSHFLITETGYKFTEIVPRLLNLMCNEIEQIDIYCAYYVHMMTAYGESQSERLLPRDFVNLIGNSFPHICASKYLREYDKADDIIFEFDHFRLGKTPAWEMLMNSECEMNIYFSGDECNPLISTADLIIRLIQEKISGTVGRTSVRKALLENCGIIGNKVHFYNLGNTTEDKRYSTPTQHLPAAVDKYNKHPIIFTLGKRHEGFEFEPAFIGMQNKAFNNKGCIKRFELRDRNFWDVDVDEVVPLDEEEKRKMIATKKFGRKLPAFTPLSSFL